MKRSLKAEELRLWSVVASTVRPAPGRRHPEAPPGAEPQVGAEPPVGAQPPPKTGRTKASQRPDAAPSVGSTRPHAEVAAPTKVARPQPIAAPDPIEPLRKRRIARDREPIEARLDLHGLDQDRARLALHGFLQRAHAEGFRAVLVITGKGALGDGVLRRRAPDWLAEAPVRALVAGYSPAERRHGGEGALYIALKRRA